MLRYIINRIFSGVAVVISVVILISAIIYLAPVDPTRLSFGQRSDDATVEARRKQLGLDLPLYQQMGRYLVDISPISSIDNTYQDQYDIIATIWSGSKNSLVIKKPFLRYSYQTGRRVSLMLSETIPKTVILALSAFLIATILGILFGIIAALYHNSKLDQFIIGFSTLGYSLPSYVSAMVLALVFGFYLKQITGLNLQGSIYELNDLGDEVVVWRNLFLPSIALGIRPVAIVTQLTRSAMLDVLSMDYIRTARAKGLAFTKVIFDHALRNTMNPVTTALTGWLASLLAGAFFVENVFNFKGVGQLTVDAMINYDVPVLLACVIFI
ncbi:MAG TPA: ABC transporter permease [Saprospirales bacterium]|nr:ABC transporter permease [Saprospirales bacterium]